MRKNEDKTLKGKMTKFVISIIFVALISFALILGVFTTIIMLNESEKAHTAQATKVSNEISSWIEKQISDVNVITGTISYDNMCTKNIDKLKDYLANCLSNNKSVYDYYVGLPNGSSYFGGGWEPEPGEYDPTTRDWYKNAVSEDKACVSSAYVDAETGKMVITISSPIKENVI